MYIVSILYVSFFILFIYSDNDLSNFDCDYSLLSRTNVDQFVHKNRPSVLVP